MKIAHQAHRERPWKVHALAPDFQLLDVWRFDVRCEERPGRDFDAFVAMHERASAPSKGLTGLLFRVRDLLGRVLRWDEGPPLPIPGCSEHEVAERLPASERAAGGMGPFRRVYRGEDEVLYELSNQTVHALMHLGLAGRSPEMAVYVKPRGLLGRAYMACIAPFRHLVVYPAMMRGARRAWEGMS